MTRDRIKDGRNWYAYCDNNPIARTDPSGLKAEVPKAPPTKMGDRLIDNVEEAERRKKESEDRRERPVANFPAGFPDPTLAGAPNLAFGWETVPTGSFMAQLELLLWFYHMVRGGGPWDYKNRFGSEYADYGNFHYGVIGAALGIPLWMLLLMAGWAQQEAGTSKPEWGSPGRGSNGDDPQDQYWIKQGYDYYHEHYKNRKKRRQ